MENVMEDDNEVAKAQYINNYLECVENLPDDLQRQLSRILDLDVTYQKYLREFTKQQKIVTNDNVDKTTKTQTLLQMQESLISLQNIGDEKLQIIQMIQSIVEKKVDQLNVQHKNLNIKEQENNEPISGSSNNLKSSYFEKRTKLNLRGRKTKLNESDKLLDLTETMVLSENQLNISTSSNGGQKKTSTANNGKKAKRKLHTNQRYEEDNQSITDDDPDEPIYCLCRQISFGKMIMCDNDSCTIEWFHFKCVSLTKKPKGKWYCPRCRGHRPNIMKLKN